MHFLSGGQIFLDKNLHLHNVLENSEYVSRKGYDKITLMCRLVRVFTVHQYDIMGGQASRKDCELENYFLYFSSKTYVVGTQKNHLIETVPLSTLNTCLN